MGTVCRQTLDDDTYLGKSLNSNRQIIIRNVYIKAPPQTPNLATKTINFVIRFYADKFNNIGNLC